MRLLTTLALLAPLTLAKTPDKDASHPRKPCTAESTTSGNYFDINPLAVHPPPSDKKHSDKDKPVQSWHARGHDYGANFTLNFCAPVVEELDDVEDVSGRLRKNISAYYERKGRTYSLGVLSEEPVIRGRKLVLNYTEGSYCPDVEDVRRRAQLPTGSGDIELEREKDKDKDKDRDDDDEDDDDDRKDKDRSRKHKSSDDKRRKSSIISLLCERNPKDDDPKVTVSFVGTVDECTYFFEARSKHACATSKVVNQPLGPSSVFGIIVLVIVLVYLIGGIMYQRIVQHQRGWRQLPNYSLWSSIFSFVSDMTIIIVAQLGRCIPGFSRAFGGRKSGYSRVGAYEENGFANGSAGRGRRNGSDDENRLIDSLDEQWED